MLRPILFATLLALTSCARPEPALTVPLFVDDVAIGEIVLPAGPGPWPLFAHLPPEAPPVQTWTQLSVEGAGGRVFSRRDPAAYAGDEEARFYMRLGEVAFAVFLVVDDDAPRALQLRATRPSLAVAGPSAVRVRTRPLLRRPNLPRLATSVDGRSAGRLREEELRGVERLAEPRRPKHVDAMRLSDLVALRAPLDRVLEVVLITPTQQVRVAGEDLKKLLLLKPTKRGAWTYKRFEGDERVESVRDVTEIAITLRP
jgi:hypothetical protein